MYLFLILFILIVLILFITFLVFAVESRILFYSNITDMETNATLSWLGSFLKATVIYINSPPMLTISLFNKEIYNRQLQINNKDSNERKVSKMDIIRSLSLSNVNVRTSYGFFSPFATGISYIILNIISQYIDIESIEQNPNFMTDDDYVYINATCNLNIGLTLINLNRLYNSSKQLSYVTSKGG